jgi:hypothetical protein
MRVPIQEHVPHLLKEALRSCGRVSLQVSGSSMLPAIWPGDRILVEATAFSDIHHGDVVLCLREDRVFAHRVVSRVHDETLRTRGDSMPANDPQISADDLLGKVTAIERGPQRFAVRPLTAFETALGRLLCHSDLAHRIALSWHSRRQAKSAQNLAAPARTTAC